MRMKIVETKEGLSYLWPFVLVTSLFFLWGFAHSILDILNKHFQEVLAISKAKSALVQMMVYGGYFLMALPAGAFIKRFGYRKGVILGLVLYAIGAFMFIPGSRIMSFSFFLFSLFIIGCGLTCLETAANPYVTVLGDPKYGASRLNLAQAFNGLGWISGPFVGGLVIFGGSGDVALPYMGIGCLVVIVALCFVKVRLPEVKEEELDINTDTKKGLWHHPYFVFGLISLFFYVAAQTGVNSFFINFVTESSIPLTNTQASMLLSFGGMGLFMTGRLAGSWLLSKVKAERLLLIFSVGAIVCMGLVIMNCGWVSLVSLFFCYLFESIMFPTIFSMSIKGLGEHTKKASSFLVMSVVGGAIAPMLMGYIGQQNISIGFLVPLFCFLIIAAYSAWYGYEKNLDKKRI